VLRACATQLFAHKITAFSCCSEFLLRYFGFLSEIAFSQLSLFAAFRAHMREGGRKLSLFGTQARNGDARGKTHNFHARRFERLRMQPARPQLAQKAAIDGLSVR
jgi:hypothetical protein